ncbi:MAG: phosphomannomutase/phosphoglucomutase [Spirochaetales bacterium]|nr:phosphomannomutase/phosphoglucomutase [Spirochaetales bacterium]
MMSSYDDLQGGIAMIDVKAPGFRQMFREYDLRGRVSGEELNVPSVQHIARAFGTFLAGRGIDRVAVGYDNRKTSLDFKNAAVLGLMAAGCSVVDIGLSLSPVLYFAQHHLQVPGGLMVTASHNPDDWSGMKLSAGPSTTLGPEEMRELYAIAAELSQGGAGPVGEGSPATYQQADVRDAYLERITRGVRLKRPLRVVIECGNGGAGVFAYEALQRIGCLTFQLYCDPDTSYPHYFPNPSNLKARARLREMVTHPYIRADLGLGFDGDGDRIGVQDELGRDVWSDTVLIFLARSLLARKPGAKIVFDVKCTQALIDEIQAAGGVPIMWKTGHSHIKAKLQEIGAALAGERSGHIFYSEGYYGYDDALYAAVQLLDFLAAQDRPFSELLTTIPQYVTSPEIAAHCDDEVKYRVVDELVAEFKAEYGQRVIDINGARVVFEDGWGLVRASSNLPELVIIFEARSEGRLREIRELFRKKILAHPEVSPDWENDIYA